MPSSSLPPLSVPLPTALDALERIQLVFGDIIERPFEKPQFLAQAPPRRLHEFATGRLCGQKAAALAGYQPSFSIGRDGRRPTWPTPLVGTISHGHGVAGAAVALAKDWAGVGLDIESLGRMQPRLHRLVLTESEHDEVGEDQDHATRIFSAKEAGYKAINPIARRFIGFQEAQVSFQPRDTDSAWFRIQYLGDHERQPGPRARQGDRDERQRRRVCALRYPREVAAG